MDYEIRKAGFDDIDLLQGMMAEIMAGMNNSAHFVGSDQDYIINHIEQSGVTYLMTEAGRAMGFIAVDIPGEAEHNLGLDIDMAEADLNGVVHMDTIVVLPEFRGRGLQKAMLEYSEKQMKISGYKDLMGTVHPDNIASLKSFISSGYVIEKTKIKYDGYLRHILRKKI